VSSTPAPRLSEETRTAEGAIRRLAAGTRLAGRYRIAGLLGVGGMGMVYRAEDEELGLPVAVKVLRPDLAEDRRRLTRFKQELVLARRVSHPNVVRTHDLGSDGDLVFLTMDFVAGRSLGELLAAEGRLPVERAVAIARQLAAALAAAHEAGVVHRDLKPGNVLIDEAGRAAISDFGIARALGSAGPTIPGSVVGTLDYMAPEQALGGEVDGRADLYALGILLYEMLTGDLPFAGGSSMEMLAQRLTGAPRDLRASRAEVPPHLASVVRRLLQREPARRHQSARELLADLDGPGRARRPAWRPVALAACGALILFAAGWVALLERRRRRRRSPRGTPSPCSPWPTRPGAATSPGSPPACRRCSPRRSPRGRGSACSTASGSSPPWRGSKCGLARSPKPRRGAWPSCSTPTAWSAAGCAPRAAVCASTSPCSLPTCRACRRSRSAPSRRPRTPSASSNSWARPCARDSPRRR
jgi:serine/threonine protein kinase